MTFHDFECPHCGAHTSIRWVGPARLDPGYWENDLECRECGADLSDADGILAEPPEPDPDSFYDRDR